MTFPTKHIPNDHQRLQLALPDVRMERGRLHSINEFEHKSGNSISKSFNFTISPYSIHGLGELPEAVRSMGVNVVAIVPYYFFPAQVGKAYKKEMMEVFGCPAFSWIGFHHENSGVEFSLFQAEYRKYLANLDGIIDYPYMAFSEDECRSWFADAVMLVGRSRCTNVEKLIDIQPNGEANFCVDFPDYSIGNVREARIGEIWNSERANRFRYHRELVRPKWTFKQHGKRF